MKSSMHVRMLSALAAALLLTGCATFDRAKAPPQSAQTVSINYTAEELSGWTDLPIGAYRIPDSQMIISGHQKGGPAGLLFGVIGVAIQNAVESGAAKSSVQDIEELLRVKLTSRAQAITNDLLATGQFSKKFTLDPAPDGPTLSVSTAVIGTYVNDTDIRFFLTLKAALVDPKGKEEPWSTRYFVSTGKARPLSGKSGWSANGGAALKQALEANLDKGIRFMLTDISAPYPRNEARLNMVRGYFPYVRSRLETNAYLLTEDQDSIAFVPKIGDVMVFAGVNIMDKSLSTHYRASTGDPYLKVLDDNTSAAARAP